MGSLGPFTEERRMGLAVRRYPPTWGESVGPLLGCLAFVIVVVFLAAAALGLTTELIDAVHALLT